MSDSTADVGTIAGNITSSFTNVTQLITASSYLAGLGFSVGAIMKFKQHKDNPTQIPVGTPIIASALLFLPTILGTANADAAEEKLEAAEADPEAAAARVTSASIAEMADKARTDAAQAGVTVADAEYIAAKRGVTPSDVAAAEGAVEKKLTS